MISVEGGFAAADNEKTAIYAGFNSGTVIVIVSRGDYGERSLGQR